MALSMVMAADSSIEVRDQLSHYDLTIEIPSADITILIKLEIDAGINLASIEQMQDLFLRLKADGQLTEKV